MMTVVVIDTRHQHTVSEKCCAATEGITVGVCLRVDRLLAMSDLALSYTTARPQLPHG